MEPVENAFVREIEQCSAIQHKIHRYFLNLNQAGGILEDRPMKNEEEENDTKTLLLRIYLNLAVCCVKTKHSGRAISYCKRCLDIDRNNAKALYLQGKVLVLIKY